MRKRHQITCSLVAVVLLTGCASFTKHGATQQTGESVVFVGKDPASLAYLPSKRQPITLRSTYSPGVATIEYVEGIDFVVDDIAGTLRRTSGSRIPDFRQNMLYGEEDFDHSKFPGFGNGRFFAFADYTYSHSVPWPAQASQGRFLQRTKAALKDRKPVKIVAFGDSITAGGDATKPGLIFWQRWADDLQRRHPRAQVTAVNGATGGDSTVQGLQRLKDKVLDQKPDLVLIGFGMNDHNRNGVPIPAFEQNLKQMITRIRDETSAEVILFSAFPPNPKWKFGTHRMPEYAAATQRVASETQCAYADVFNNWQSLAVRKKPEDLLGNNINHPNDFGHWIYFRVFQQLGL